LEEARDGLKRRLQSVERKLEELGADRRSSDDRA
jgi:hypothetical protein